VSAAFNREQLFEMGVRVMREFCNVNAIFTPEVRKTDQGAWPYSECAYYRPSYMAICVPRCAWIGTAGRAWSFPGYTVDRTPYGVLQHELGHHVDVLRGQRPGAYWSEFSKAVREASGEKPVTSYCPNDAEWFAEMFRVYVTNPDLLLQVRPRTHRELRSCFEPVFRDSWRDRLQGAPARTITAAERQIEKAQA
jgi:hypothetical protein